MCIGIPMQVVRVEPGHAVCAGRGETRRVRTALVGDASIGEWLLVFIDSARERLEDDRAREISATLDLLHSAWDGVPAAAADTAFALPSGWTTAQLRALAGTPPPHTTESDS